MMRFIVGIAMAALAVTANASPARRPGFDPATVTTLAGEVKEVRTIPGRRVQGVHLELGTDEGLLDVHLGPSPFLDRQSVKIEAGDRIEVTGSKVTWDGKPIIIAQTVKKGDATLTLRNAKGIPVWVRTRK